MGSGISPREVVDRIWAIYRSQFGVLVGTALILFALQFLIALLLSGSLVLVVVVLFWVISTLYQGMVVELVSDIRDGRRDHSQPVAHLPPRGGSQFPFNYGQKGHVKFKSTRFSLVAVNFLSALTRNKGFFRAHSRLCIRAEERCFPRSCA